MTAIAHATAAPGSVSPPQTTSPPSSLDPLANEETFLKLLVSQLKNQDPLKPPDSNQFVAQLTSYSQLEQLIGIRQNTTNPASGTDPGPTTPIPLISNNKAG